MYTRYNMGNNTKLTKEDKKRIIFALEVAGRNLFSRDRDNFEKLAKKLKVALENE